MKKQFIFISCGQYSEKEKRLGKEIADMVRRLTGLEPFFAEEVQGLNGLDTNILDALHNCIAFITVLHPRGDITRPDKVVQTRASIWIEQEIAVATYIQRMEKRPLPIIAFKHVSVGREGIRDLLQLNPIEFTDESEVLAALRERLKLWRSLKPSGIELDLDSGGDRQQEGHMIRTLGVILVNDTNQRISGYDCQVWLPAGILKHWGASYQMEVPSNEPGRRSFRFDEKYYGPLNPRERKRLFTTDYCTACAVSDCGGIAALVGEANVEAKIWIEGREYAVDKTIQGLSKDAESRGAY